MVCPSLPPAARPPAEPARCGKAVRLALALAVLATTLSATAQQGLQARPEAVASASVGFGGPDALRLRLQQGDLRLDLGYQQTGAQAARARVFGDFFLTGPGFGQGQVSGGLRLTSGVTFGLPQETGAQGPHAGPAPVLRPKGGFLWREPESAQRVALPYIGVGYSSMSVREGWGVSADIGLGGQRPGERWRLGSGGGIAAQAERVLSDVRMAPVLQVGVSYAF
jgi:hypothetical protein